MFDCHYIGSVKINLEWESETLKLNFGGGWAHVKPGLQGQNIATLILPPSTLNARSLSNY
jgi:hypothetical protein